MDLFDSMEELAGLALVILGVFAVMWAAVTLDPYFMFAGLGLIAVGCL